MRIWLLMREQQSICDSWCLKCKKTHKQLTSLKICFQWIQSSKNSIHSTFFTLLQLLLFSSLEPNKVIMCFPPNPICMSSSSNIKWNRASRLNLVHIHSYEQNSFFFINPAKSTLFYFYFII